MSGRKWPLRQTVNISLDEVNLRKGRPVYVLTLECGHVVRRAQRLIAPWESGRPSSDLACRQCYNEGRNDPPAWQREVQQ